MTTPKNLDSIGSQTALLIGAPMGLLFAFFAFVLSLFPPFDMLLFATGGGLMWHPAVVAVGFPLVFATLLWRSGKRIKGCLDQGYPLIWISFLFTFNVNKGLFGLMLTLFLISGLFFAQPTIDRFTSIWVGVAFSVVIFLFSTVVTTFTIGLLIVGVARHRICRIQ